MSDPFRTNTPTMPVGHRGAPTDDGIMGEIRSEISTEAAPLFTFMLKNLRYLVAGVSLFALVVAGVGIYNWQQNNTLQKARLELGRILISAPSAEQVASLQAFLDNAPQSMRPAVLLELGAAAVAVEDYATAASAYADLQKADPKGALGSISAFNQADILQRENQPEKALALLEALEKTAPAIIKRAALEEMAALADEAGQHEKAIGFYEQLLALGTGATGAASEAAYYQARIASIKAAMAQ